MRLPDRGDQARPLESEPFQRCFQHRSLYMLTASWWPPGRIGFADLALTWLEPRSGMLDEREIGSDRPFGGGTPCGGCFLILDTCPSEPEQRSEEHTSELQSRENIVCRLLLAKKKKNIIENTTHTQKKQNSENMIHMLNQ